MAEKTIRANFIIEMMGRPKEHVEKTMKELINQIRERKSISIINEFIHEVKEIESNKEEKSKKISVSQKLFTTFAEVEADFDNVEELVKMAFVYMPSHVEIISPNEILFDKIKIEEIITGIILKLHKYDEVAKKLAMENQILGNKIRELLEKEIQEKNKKEKDEK